MAALQMMLHLQASKTLNWTLNLFLMSHPNIFFLKLPIKHRERSEPDSSGLCNPHKHIN